MNKTILALLVVTGTLVLTGCLTVTDIRLNPDESAHITISNYSIDSFLLCRSSYFKSDQISNLDSVLDSLELKYDIRTIDSLGNYLYSDFNKGFFRFNYQDDTLTFSDGNGPPCPTKTSFTCWTNCISITSDRRIKTIIASHHIRVKREGNTVYLTKKGVRYNRPSKNSRVVIVYE